jgi:hypothetical protein
MAGLFGIPITHMENWGSALAAKPEDKPWTTTPEYHQWGTADLTQEKSKELAQNYGNLAAGAFELAAPAMALGASPIYDTGQAIWKYKQNPDEYSGIWNAIDREDVLSSAWNRMLGASVPLANRMKTGLTNVEKFGGKLYNYMHGPQMRFKKRKDRIMSQAKKQAAMQQQIQQAQAAQAAKQKITPTYAGPITHDFDPKQDTGRRPDKPGGFLDPGKGSYGPHKAQGGIVDLYRHGGF